MSNVQFGSNITVRGAGLGATVFLMDPAAASPQSAVGEITGWL
jgi:hypothetical protein